MDAAGNVSSKSVISADVECSLSETQAQHLLHAVRSPRLKASDSGTATSIPGKEEKVVVTEQEEGGLEG